MISGSVDDIISGHREHFMHEMGGSLELYAMGENPAKEGWEVGSLEQKLEHAFQRTTSLNKTYTTSLKAVTCHLGASYTCST